MSRGPRLAALVAAATLWPLAASPPAARAASTCAAQGVTVAALQSSVFYVDSGSGYRGSYVGFRVGNSGGTTREGLWVRLASFTGSVVGPADGASATASVPLPALAAGAAAPAFHYLKATGATTTAQPFDVVVLHEHSGTVTELCRETQSVSRVHETIDAAANKVTGSTLVGGAQAVLGSTFQLRVTGDTGQLGAGIAQDPGVFRASPAVAATWPAGSFRLVAVEHEMPTPGTPVADVLWRGGLGSWPDTAYAMTYTFRVVGPTTSATPVVPVQHIASGTQVKHTDPKSFAGIAPIPVVTSTTTVAVGAAATGPHATGSHVPLTVTATNTGGSPVALDAFVATLPAGWSPVPGTSTVGGQAVDDPEATGQTSRWTGPHTVPAGGTLTLAFDAVAGAPGTSGTFEGYGTLSGGRIDATLSPADSVPATTTLQVLGPPVAHGDAVTAYAGHPATWDVLANDALNGATPTLTIVDEPDHGTAQVVAGELRYEPGTGFSGADELVYEVATLAGTATATVTITVAEPPPPPTAVDLVSTGRGRAAQQRTVTRPDGGRCRLLDEDGAEALEVLLPGGTFSLDATTCVATFAPARAFLGTATVGFRVGDAIGQEDDGAWEATVTLPDPPEAPDHTPATVGIAPVDATVDVPADGTVTLVDPEDGDVTSVAREDGAYVLDPATGVVTFTPALGRTAPAAAAYAVEDEYGQRALGAVRPSVTAPAGPQAEDVASSGTGTARHTVTLAAPSGGVVRLLAADGTSEVLTRTVAGVGTWTLDPETLELRLDPVLGFHGTTTLPFRVTDAWSQHDDGEHEATVALPAGPAATARSSRGTGTAVQAVTVAPPAGGRVRLLAADGTTELLTRTVAGEGRYDLTPGTGRLTFTPALGFAGEATPLPFRVVDAYGQPAGAAYTATVDRPAPPATAAVATTGAPAAPQAAAPIVPEGARLELLDATGVPVPSLVVPGQGEYVLDADGGTIRFVPLPGFAGAPTPARFRVVDPYGQATEADFQPQVDAAVLALPLAEALPAAGAPAPAARATCSSRRTMTVNWVLPRGVRVRAVRVLVAGRVVGRPGPGVRRATVDLRARGRGAVVTRVVVDATDGRRFATSRTYRPCRKRLARPALPTLVLRPIGRATT